MGNIIFVKNSPSDGERYNATKILLRMLQCYTNYGFQELVKIKPKLGSRAKKYSCHIT